MLFNSIGFALFLLGVFALHWLLPRRATCQNALLLGASLFFYAYWDWRLLGLFVGSVTFTYLIGLRLQSAGKTHAKFLMWCGIGGLLGALCVFKYYNFFVNLLKGHHVPVDFVIAPASHEWWARYQGTEELEALKTRLSRYPQVKVVDLGDREGKFYDRTNWIDAIHLNQKGAMAFSSMLRNFFGIIARQGDLR